MLRWLGLVQRVLLFVSLPLLYILSLACSVSARRYMSILGSANQSKVVGAIRIRAVRMHKKRLTAPNATARTPLLQCYALDDNEMIKQGERGHRGITDGMGWNSSLNEMNDSNDNDEREITCKGTHLCYAVHAPTRWTFGARHRRIRRHSSHLYGVQDIWQTK